VASGIRGISRLGEVARDARRAGGKPAVVAMRKAIQAPARPAKRLVTASARTKMPAGGGYATLLSRAIRVRIMTDTGFTTASVTVVTRARGKATLRDLPALNNGRLRHPPWGRRRSTWVTQAVPPGFWDEPMEVIEKLAGANMVDVLDDMARKLAGKG
jgi:hypothetical protein